MPSAMKASATLIRRNGYVGAAAVASLATFVLALVLGIFAPATAPDFVLATLAFGWPVVIVLIGAWASYWRPWRTNVAVEIADGELRVDGATLRRPGTLSDGDATLLAPERVRLELRAVQLPRVRLEVAKAATARALLAELGLDRRSGTTRFRVRLLREYAGLLVGAMFLALPIPLVLATVNGFLGLSLLALMIVLPILDSQRARLVLTVGADGIDLRSPFGRTFIPHARIRSITKIWPGGHATGPMHAGESSYGFDIDLDDGTGHRIDTRRERARADASSSDATFDAAMLAWSTWRHGPAGAQVATSTLLARGDRSTSAWIANLRALAIEGASGYRVAAIDEEALFAVLVDADAPREVRAAAAVVLGAKEQHAPRLRVVADDVADPIVRRIAVATALAGDEPPLEADLDEASPPDQGRASTRGPS